MGVRFVFIISPLLFLLYSFQENDMNKIVVQALKSNDAKALTKYFSSSINLSINSEEQIVTKFQGELLLTDFLKQNKVVEVKRVTASENHKTNRYFIYSIKTTKRNFRVLVKVIELKGAALISELRVD
ncbi:DUF4783 domain-containing protein [Sphingobacterium paucimobilis]|uniref:DUF4783 domain-containing protein n=1 Tax=Sphingobacterium paucimobilis HER1398 TaxID=1346330 RepID=U2JF23_9SPHI|nr:DUF4783 domain-containing protein [Sphingobacterium paucimobilis]ERJ61273.1 hypothetical protein M472_21195 [Sphingobacterium paucimobilis HER1398]